MGSLWNLLNAEIAVRLDSVVDGVHRDATYFRLSLDTSRVWRSLCASKLSLQLIHRQEN